MTALLKEWSICFNRNIEYGILSSTNIFDYSNITLASIGMAKGSKRFIVLDSGVSSYKSQIESYFDYHGILSKIIEFNPGEVNKSMESFVFIVNELEDFPIKRRDEPIIAIGGGVLTDIVGFVASTYRRGIPHIKIPTTLMGYIDAAIGIKTGINYNHHKNRLGAFEPPAKVILDKGFLKSLPERHVLNGLGEIIKIAIIKDSYLFSLLENIGKECVAEKFQSVASSLILECAIEAIIEELAPNLYEDNLSRAADFGHTFSLAYEMKSNHEILHGEAVVIDIILSIFLANVKNILADEHLQRMLRLISQFYCQIPKIKLSEDILWESVLERTYHRNGLQRIPLPYEIGKFTFVNDVTFDQVSSSCKLLEQWTKQYE